MPFSNWLATDIQKVNLFQRRRFCFHLDILHRRRLLFLEAMKLLESSTIGLKVTDLAVVPVNCHPVNRLPNEGAGLKL